MHVDEKKWQTDWLTDRLTFLSQDVLDSLCVALVLCSDRPDSHTSSSGVSVYVRSSVHHNPCPSRVVPQPVEYIWLCVPLPNKALFVCVVYHPPTPNSDDSTLEALSTNIYSALCSLLTVICSMVILTATMPDGLVLVHILQYMAE